VQLVYEPSGESRPLASRVETADSLLTQAKGLMGVRSLPEGYALAFRFDRAKTRDVHMLFVFVPLDVLWIVDGEVARVERMRPFVSYARAPADLLVELPAGAAEGVEPGSTVRLIDR